MGLVEFVKKEIKKEVTKSIKKELRPLLKAKKKYAPLFKK